ncbi:OLC1v1007464C1 [Oldenlandia corymbosa var. corymbosa]|uniref:OLC1v1007464C1 n=1 Tax=Oldenlandia corymbosa var. corymbosa TaxID=529605 RepID=A0AAV1DMP1_OLDCO|nr:OLC1v1007464C1 [Oldenlandia corymbosa var. corymbosa]
MAVPDAAVSFLLENVTQLLVYNVNLIGNVKENVEDLRKSLKLLQGSMNDLIKLDTQSKAVKETVQSIKELIWRAEDAIDSYRVQAAIQKKRPVVEKLFFGIAHYPAVLRELAKGVEDIGKEIDKINQFTLPNVCNQLQIAAMVNLSKPPAEAAPKEGPIVEEEHVIGFDGAAQTVEDMLIKGPEHLEVISIVGMLGLGKTTLAKMVYKDSDVDYAFMARAFVYLSKDYDKREVLLKILADVTKSAPSEEVTRMNLEQLESHLKQLLDGRTYLVVLDDVWEQQHWDSLLNVFPKNNRRCRVLITTRNVDVAKYANPSLNSLYKLDFLSDENCQELLRWRVFRQNDCPSELVNYEKIIVAKCAGLPLAVVVIAGILLNHSTVIDWWRHVADSVKDYIARDAAKTAEVIHLMYHHLPNYLKTCFLYLGVFREDFEIQVWKLVRMWISEGFIQNQDKFNLEVMAEQYLEELVHRNLVMVGKRRANGKIKTCRMHDTLREFCKKQAAEENLFGEIKADNLSSSPSSENQAVGDYRRLCINNVSLSTYLAGAPSGKSVRSLLACPKDETTMDAKLVSNITKAFNLLRILETEAVVIIPRLPADFCSLVLLQYVAISLVDGFIPPVFSNLLNLQTLIVNTKSNALEIKANIWDLPQFRHLHTNASTSISTKNQTKGKEAAQPNKNVQTLCSISPGMCTKEVFKKTPNLKKLGVRGSITSLLEVNDDSNLFAHLYKLESLENLKLLNGDTESKVYRLPPKDKFPPQLTQLTLLNTLLNWRAISLLGELENLEVLKLKENACEGEIWNLGQEVFARLKHLHIGRTDLMVWTASADNFPNLKSLELDGCSILRGIPNELADITSLQSVALNCTNNQVAASARRLQLLKVERAKKAKIFGNFKVSVYPPDF